MNKSSLVFIRSKTNKNSIMALKGVLETYPLKNLDVKTWSEEKLDKFPFKALADYLNVFLAFSFQTPGVLQLAPSIPRLKKQFSKYHPRVTFLAGGPHPSGAPQQTLKMGFDFVFIGEGEESLRKFLKTTIGGKRNFSSIKGLAFFQGNKLFSTGRAKPVDISKYPPVARCLNLFSPIEISRGCPFACKFCQTSYLFGKQRHRTLKQIVWAVRQLVKKGFVNIRFITPNLLAYGSKDGLTPNLESLEEMLAAVKRVRGVKKIFAGTFPSEIRPEQISKKALAILKRYCNNDNIIIGAQSGSERMLRLSHRMHTPDDVYKAVELATRGGFKVNVDFIFGMPGETPSDLEKSIKMIKRLIQNPKVKIHSHSFLPLPGTPWENKKPGKISPMLRKFLISLRRKGKEYGEWEKQEKIGKKLSEYFKHLGS